jgi:hypothetical protein
MHVLSRIIIAGLVLVTFPVEQESEAEKVLQMSHVLSSLPSEQNKSTHHPENSLRLASPVEHTANSGAEGRDLDTLPAPRDSRHSSILRL